MVIGADGAAGTRSRAMAPFTERRPGYNRAALPHVRSDSDLDDRHVAGRHPNLALGLLANLRDADPRGDLDQLAAALAEPEVAEVGDQLVNHPLAGQGQPAL